MQVAENLKKMESLCLRTLASGLVSSQNPNKQKHNNVTDERSDSSEYLPGAEEGQEEDDDFDNTCVEKVSSQSWLGVFTLGCPMYILRLIFM